MKMTKEELKAKLDAHRLWLETRRSDEVKGERLNLAWANLTGANLTGADLTYADLRGADLRGADLRGADLGGADLRGADLTHADLGCADLGCADLTHANLADANLADTNLLGANLTGANLAHADLTGANLDYSAWPLKCSSLNVEIDKRLAAQLMYHAMRAMQSCSDDASVAAVLASPECVALANQFHYINKCGPLEVLSSEREADKQ